jgi:hypothetical protein
MSSDPPVSAERDPQAAATASPGELARLLQQLAAAGGVPIMLSTAPAQPVDTARRLAAKAPASVPFPACADTLLALIRTGGVAREQKDEITLLFDEYFKFGPPRPLVDRERLGAELDPALLECLGRRQGGWPPECCLCPPCLVLDGDRNPSPTTPGAVRRLFAGDTLLLFHWEWVFQVLGAILSDWAIHGRLPISNGTLEAGARDDLVAVVLEAMTRATRTGESSSVRERDSTFRRVLGWTSEAGRRLGVEAQANTGLSTQLHALLHHALQFFDARRMAVAIRGSAAPVPPPSVATLTTIGDLVRGLRKRLEPFDYGRNAFNTLNGIVWLIAGMSVVRELRGTLGIPPAFDQPHEYLDAAYAILVQKRAVTGGEPSRAALSRDLARHGRDLLLDLEVLDDRAADFASVGGELERWLGQVEAKIEGYRNAYRTLTGVDLGAAAPATVPQQA